MSFKRKARRQAAQAIDPTTTWECGYSTDAEAIRWQQVVKDAGLICHRRGSIIFGAKEQAKRAFEALALAGDRDALAMLILAHGPEAMIDELRDSIQADQEAIDYLAERWPDAVDLIR